MQIIIISIFLLIPSLFPSAHANSPNPVEFYSDGCSNFPDGNWLQCCVSHDALYYAGGSKAERKNADLLLYGCVAKVKNRALALLMYQGVRRGGSPTFNTSFRWGYAWPYGRGYRAVSAEERLAVRKKLRAYKCEREMLSLTRDRDLIEQICKALVPGRASLSEGLSTFFNRF